jgi:phosphoglycerol transferase MdoB-like AlkP superfamily enzyme
MKAFMVHSGFDRIKEIYDFKPGLLQGKLGIHDEFTLKEQLQDLDNETQPFFSALFTLSSHSPYDQPMREKVQGGKNEHEYINSAYYTDWCLGTYFELAKQTDWYKNTLFVLVADHSHNSYNNWPVNSFEYNRIPILICGGALKKEYHGKKYEQLVSQTDIASTLLAQLGQKHSEFYYSRNLFNKYYKPFSYLTFDYGIGIKKAEGSFIWGTSYQQPAIEGMDKQQAENAEKEAKSFLQTLFQTYLNY